MSTDISTKACDVTTGLLDTSVVIDWHDPSVVAGLPDEMAISAISAAELAAGPLLAASPIEAAKRQTRLQEVESRFEPIPFDGAAARSYGLVVAAVVGQGRQPKSRFADLLIAATAHANRLDLYSRNPDDFTGLEDLVRVIAV
jgi:predicted nucleic acid-binding protein